MDSDGGLQQRLAEMSARITSLETKVASLEGGVQARTAGPSGETQPASPESLAAPIASPIIGKPARLAAATPGSSLENRIGAQLLNRIGILAVLIGMAWFLKLAFDRNWIGPEVRVLIGLACAAGLMAWSESFRRRGFPAFSYSLKALGTSIAYLSLWAAFDIFRLAPAWLILLSMTAVTLVNAVMARRQDSELLALYALAGGLATPGLLSIGHSNEVFLFCYLVLLNLGALLLLAIHPWKRLAWAALLGTAAYYLGLTITEHYSSRLPARALFLCAFFAVFAAVPFLLLRKISSPSPASADPFFSIAYPIVNAAATWLALTTLFDSVDHPAGQLWITLMLALACLSMAAVARGVALSRTNLGMGIFFITVAVPLQFSDYVVTLCWLGEALALVALAKVRADAAMRAFASVLLAVAAFRLLLDWIIGPPQPLAVFANMHFATNLIGAAVFAAVTVLSLRAQRAGKGWTLLAGLASVAFNVTLLVAVSLEIHHYWFCGAGLFHDLCGGYGQAERRALAAGFSYSAWWILYGAALMAVGFLRRSALVRWQALVLLALSIGKVFLNGVSLESQGYRVLSFLALGVVLLAVSFAYQKNWLRLRG